MFSDEEMNLVPRYNFSQYILYEINFIQNIIILFIPSFNGLRHFTDVPIHVSVAPAVRRLNFFLCRNRSQPHAV